MCLILFNFIEYWENFEWDNIGTFSLLQDGTSLDKK